MGFFGSLDLTEVAEAVQKGWGSDTCDPDDLADWSPDTPSRGQCGVTALVVQDLLGGDLVLGHRCRSQYERLQSRVFASLGIQAAGD